jgi:hypothetical protein
MLEVHALREIHVLIVLIFAVIIVGLVLRYGATSVPLATTGEKTVTNVLNDLTLKGSGYPYESPKGKS